MHCSQIVLADSIDEDRSRGVGFLERDEKLLVQPHVGIASVEFEVVGLENGWLEGRVGERREKAQDEDELR